MANNIVKEIKVGNTIYEIKDKHAITGIKIGEGTNPILPGEDGILELSSTPGTNTGEDMWLRGVVRDLVDNYLAPLAFLNDSRPDFDYDIQKYSVQVRSQGLQNCRITSILPDEVTANSSFDITIEAFLNYYFDENAITSANFEGSGYSSIKITRDANSNSKYVITVQGVTDNVNLNIKDITATEVQGGPAEFIVNIIQDSNSQGTYTCTSNTGSLTRITALGGTFTFTTTGNYRFDSVDDVNVDMKGDHDDYITKTLVSNKKITVNISMAIGDVDFRVTTHYAHQINVQLNNCHAADTIPSESTSDVSISTTIIPNNEHYSVDAQHVVLSISDNNCAQYDPSTQTLTITLVEKQDVSVTITAGLVQEQPSSESKKITMKLLNMKPLHDGSYTRDNYFGYYEITVSTDTPFTENIQPISYELNNETVSAVSNDDLKVLGIGDNYEATVLVKGTDPDTESDGDYTFSGTQLKIRSNTLQNYKEFIVSATAHKSTVVLTFNDQYTNVGANYKQIKLKCATEDRSTKHTFIINLTTDVQQIDGENKVIVELTDSGTDFSIIEEIVNGSLNHLLQLQRSLIKADFGGHKFCTTKDHAQLFASNGSNVITTLEGFVVKEASNLSKWFAASPKLSKLQTIGWDLSSTTNMTSTFDLCGSTDNDLKLDLDYMDVRNVSQIERCFYGTRLSELKVQGWKLNQNENAVGISLKNLFAGINLQTIDIRTWEVNNLTSFERTFYGQYVKTIYMQKISTNKLGSPYVLTSMNNMFGCNEPKTLDDVYVGNLHAGSSDLDITQIVCPSTSSKNSGIKSLYIKNTEVLEINQDKNWINAALIPNGVGSVYIDTGSINNPSIKVLARP